MDNRRKSHARSTLFGLVTTIGMAVSMALCAAPAHPQAQPLVTVPGSPAVAGSDTPATAAIPIEGEPVPHAGDSSGIVTISAPPDGEAAGIGEVPVPHAGGGSVATRTSPSASAQTPANKASTAGPAIVAALPVLQVSGSCNANGVGALTITDVGASMTTPYAWRLYQNGTLIATNNFQLNAGASTSVNTSGIYGTLRLDVVDATNTVVATGSMFCQTPPPPAFQVSGNCAPNAAGTLTITNVGGNMTVPFSWRLSLNGTPISTNTFQLNAGASTNVNTSGLYGTLVLDVLDATSTVVASGSMFCRTQPPPIIQITGGCASNAVGALTITDIGAAMPSAFTWQLALNGTPIATNPFQLNAGASTAINTSGLFGTITVSIVNGSSVLQAAGSMYCPASVAPPPPTFQASASCGANANGAMTVSNVGGNMAAPLAWRVTAGGVQIAQGTFQINGGRSLNVYTGGNHIGTLTLSVLDGSNAVVAASAMFCQADSLDVDGNGQYSALGDGLLMLRYLFGLSGTPLVNGAIGAGSTRSAAADIVAYLDPLGPLLDIDNNGHVDALTDGVMLLRYLFGIRGPSLISGAVGPNAQRATAPLIEAYIQSLMP